MKQQILEFLQHPYFLMWFFVWMCIIGYGTVIVMAFLSARLRSGALVTSAKKLVQLGYDSWMMPLFLHLATIVMVVTFLVWKLWKQQTLTGHWMFLVPMLSLVIFDFYILLSLNKKKERILKRI